MDQEKKEFLLEEYSAILEHSRSHQNTRFNVTLFSIAAVGAIMLNCFKEDDSIRIASVIINHLLVLIMVSLDFVFISRLKEYFSRVVEIESEFNINGFFSKRRRDLKNYHKGATSTILQFIFYLLFSVNLIYSLIVIYKCQKMIHDAFGSNYILINWILILFFLGINLSQFLWVKNKLNVRKVLKDIKVTDLQN